MSNPFAVRVGGILSADIAVPEHERELRFYSQVLTTGAQPHWREDLMNNHGTPIIGLGKRTPKYENLPLVWMPHIMVADVAASAARALELGGSEILHGKDEDGNSLWAGLKDPNGIAFGIIPVVTPDQVPTIEGDGPVGCIGWVDLTVPEDVIAPTRDFYRDVIGWTVEEVPMEDGAYADFNMCGSDGNPAAGICHARGSNQDLPPVWMHYLTVADLDESLRRVEAEGGKVLKSVQGTYSFAIVEDPIGVPVALVAT